MRAWSKINAQTVLNNTKMGKKNTTLLPPHSSIKKLKHQMDFISLKQQPTSPTFKRRANWKSYANIVGSEKVFF